MTESRAQPTRAVMLPKAVASQLSIERRNNMAIKRYIEIQDKVIAEYRIDLCDGTKCKRDWSRTHAHVKKRRVCKWKRANSIQSTFTLLHEIGHIETTKSYMRRAESEYHATMWAIDKCKELGLDIPHSIIKDYQDYIDMEIDRGKRRGGSGYGELILTV